MVAERAFCVLKGLRAGYLLQKVSPAVHKFGGAWSQGIARVE